MRFVAFLATVVAFSLPAFGACPTPLTDADNTLSRANLSGDLNHDFTGDAFLCTPGNADCDNTINIEGTGGYCAQGGSVRWNMDEAMTRTDAYALSSGGSALRLANFGTYHSLFGMRLHNTFDGVKVNDPFNVFGSWFSYIRDDCIENDRMARGVIEDSLFDGCYVFLSARNKDATLLPKGDVTVRDSLIRMQAMPGPDGPNKDDPNFLGHGATFKFSPSSPPLNLENNIFLFDDEGIDWRADRFLGFPASLNRCVGNIIVWLGAGPFPGNIPDDPNCVTVTTDPGVWNQARDQWLVDHPNVERISGVDDPVVVVSNPDSTTSTNSGTYDVANLGDTEPPSVTFLSPAKLVQRKSEQIIEVAATDNVGVLRVEISIDGYLYAVLENNWSVNWSVPPSPNGSYEISATAIDLSGNYSTQAIHVFATR